MKSWKYKHIWNWDSLESLSQPVRKQKKQNLILTEDLEDLEPAVQPLDVFLVSEHFQFISFVF